MLERAEPLQVESLTMPVLPFDDVFVSQLLSLWASVRRRTADHAFARAFFAMVEGLGVVQP